MNARAISKLAFFAGSLLIALAGPDTALPVSAGTLVLITREEANLPAYRPPSKGLGEEPGQSRPGLRWRGLAAGPQLIVVAPPAKGGTLIAHRPVSLHIRFRTAEDGAAIDLNSLRVTYLRLWGIDITDRIKPYLSTQGIDVDNADIPPGEHSIELEVRDTLGRVIKQVLKLSVS